MSSSPKKTVYEQLARIGQALSSAPRLELLELLAQTERSVESLVGLTGLSIANTSRHLQQLRLAGMVGSRKQGQYVYYRLAGDAVVDLLGSLGTVAETHLAEMDGLLRSSFATLDDAEPVSAEEVLESARKGQVTVIDVRPPEEYAAGHVPGAINIPLPELQNQLDALPKRKKIVAYCRGPYCLMSFAAVKTLRAKGFKARRLVAGMPEWRSAGLPVATTSI